MITAYFKRHPKGYGMFDEQFIKRFNTLDEVAAFAYKSSHRVSFWGTSDSRQTQMICQKIAGMVRSRHRLHIPNKDITEIETYLNTLKE